MNMPRLKDDGMQHDYSTCPRCRRIASSENIVWVDGQRMCRRCLKTLTEQEDVRDRDV